MKLYPENAATQLEFDKVKALLAAHCNTIYAKYKAEKLRIHTRKDFIELELQQTHRQQVELLKHQNKISEERIAYLKDMEHKLRQMILEWRKTDKKEEVIKQINTILFPKNEKAVTGKMVKKIQSKYEELNDEILVGSKVMLKKNHQVGEVKEIRGKRAIVQVGLLPMNIELNDLVTVKEKQQVSNL